MGIQIKTREKKTVYNIITERILENLKKNIIPWKQTWSIVPPCNYVSKRAYTGVNILLLSTAGFNSPFWLTANQIAKLGGKIKNGEKPQLVTAYFPLEKVKKKKNGESKVEKIFRLKYYKVWNWEQTIGLKEKKLTVKNIDSLKEAAKFVDNMQKKPTITTNSAKNPHYNIELDVVSLPHLSQFISAEEYYNTLFHELVHSTTHTKRLSRTTKKLSYAKEELVAEIGASFLSSLTGLKFDEKNNQAYIKHWISKLENDSKLIVEAANMAQKAVDYILGEEFCLRAFFLEMEESDIEPEDKINPETEARFSRLEMEESNIEPENKINPETAGRFSRLEK